MKVIAAVGNGKIGLVALWDEKNPPSHVGSGIYGAFMYPSIFNSSTLSSAFVLPILFMYRTKISKIDAVLCTFNARRLARIGMLV